MTRTRAWSVAIMLACTSRSRVGSAFSAGSFRESVREGGGDVSSWDEDALRIVVWPSRYDEHHAGWVRFDCGCCGGIAWGGESPVECETCKAGGWLSLHVRSGSVALWPGGPFVGWRMTAAEREEVLARVVET